MNKLVHIQLKLSRPELVFHKCQLSSLCGNSDICTNTVSTQYQNITDENKNIHYAFYFREQTVKNKLINKHGLKSCNGFLSLKCFKFPI